MKVFTSNDFPGYYPAKTAAVIVAKDEEQAREVLIGSLNPRIKQEFDRGFWTVTLKELNITRTNVLILCDGDY